MLLILLDVARLIVCFDVTLNNFGIGSAKIKQKYFAHNIIL